MSNNEGINNAVSMVSNFYSDLKENNLLYIGLFIVIILSILTIYFLYTMIGRFLFLKVSTTVNETTVPVLCNKLSQFEAKFPDAGNGRRRSYSFWIYIYDISKHSGNYRTVAAVSDENDYESTSSEAYRKASPHIFLDKTNNKLYCNFYNKNTGTNVKHFTSLTDTQIDEYMRSGIEIKYVPVQRWVHIAIVVNSDSFTTNMYAYVDADLVNSNKDGGPSDNLSRSSDQSLNKSYNDIELDKTKYLYVGGDITNSKNGAGFSGLISNFSCYNYELNQNDIANIYQQGPVNGLLAYLGLGLYGIRNPIYKL